MDGNNVEHQELWTVSDELKKLQSTYTLSDILVPVLVDITVNVQFTNFLPCFYVAIILTLKVSVL